MIKIYAHPGSCSTFKPQFGETQRILSDMENLSNNHNSGAHFDLISQRFVCLV